MFTLVYHLQEKCVELNTLFNMGSYYESLGLNYVTTAMQTVTLYLIEDVAMANELLNQLQADGCSNCQSLVALKNKLTHQLEGTLLSDCEVKFGYRLF